MRYDNKHRTQMPVLRQQQSGAQRQKKQRHAELPMQRLQEAVHNKGRGAHLHGHPGLHNRLHKDHARQGCGARGDWDSFISASAGVATSYGKQYTQGIEGSNCRLRHRIRRAFRRGCNFSKKLVNHLKAFSQAGAAIAASQRLKSRRGTAAAMDRKQKYQ